MTQPTARTAHRLRRAVMPSLREAATQALEALEDFGMKYYENTGEVLHRDVYESLKSALAEHDKKIVWVEERKAHWAEQLQLARETQERERQQREEAALAEQVQEPVAWRWGYRSITTGEMDWRGYVEIAADPNLRSPAIIMEPLYTAQRKPLTDDEIKKLLIEHAGMTVVFSEVDLRFARAVERAHGIGGQP